MVHAIPWELSVAMLAVIVSYIIDAIPTVDTMTISSVAE